MISFPALLIRVLTALDWTLWAVLWGALVYAFVTILADRSPGARTGTGLSVVLAGLGLGFSAAAGLLLHWLSQMQSLTGLVVLTLALVWPLSPLVKRLLAPALAQWGRQQGKTTHGSTSSS